MMDGLRDSTIEWYAEWLEKTRPDLTSAQRVELAIGFTDAQCTPPKKADGDVTDEDLTLLVDATEKQQMRKQERLTEAQLKKILDMKPAPPKPAQAEVKSTARRLSDYKE